MRIAFIGAGSVVFTKNLLTDILSFAELHGATIALHDIDPERLADAGLMARWISGQLGADAVIEEHPDRRAALAGCDFVINMVRIGMHEATVRDFTIPKKYGVKQTIADTLGIGGIFRGLRTLPFVLDLAREMTELCPRAVLINYTNPMSMLTWAVYRAFPALQVVGLCHSVQGTARKIAGYIGVPPERLVYEAAGINHHVWMLRLEVDGEDVYPRLRAALDDPAIVAQDPVRFALLRHFGYFVTESSEHNAEYTPYFLKRDDLIARYNIPVDDYFRRYEMKTARYAETQRKLRSGEGFPLNRSAEYGSLIIHAMMTDQPRVIYGNVENTGLVDNLPSGCCVEVPVLVDRTGLRPVHAGALPTQLLGMVLPHVVVQELVVKAVLEGNREHVYHAALLDRHTASVLSLDEIHALVDELIAAHGDLMPAGIREAAPVAAD
ncbi:MAG: alpha-glucosidase/alpha-galactosidase [Thermomicrobiales bacterium]